MYTIAMSVRPYPRNRSTMVQIFGTHFCAAIVFKASKVSDPLLRDGGFKGFLLLHNNGISDKIREKATYYNCWTVMLRKNSLGSHYARMTKDEIITLRDISVRMS
jgi:hypothetical protein